MLNRVELKSSNREFFYAKKPLITKRVLFCFHGSREIARKMASKTINEFGEETFIVYGQASGKPCNSQLIKHPMYGGTYYGDFYFGIHDGFSDATASKEIQYVQDIWDYLVFHISPELKNVPFYFLGFSNGGVFACLLPIELPNMFDGIISFMGGIGHDPHFVIPFWKLKTEQETKGKENKVHLLFYTNLTDIHREPCEQAYEIFTAEDFDNVRLYIEQSEEQGHHFKRSNCKFLYQWILSIEKNQSAYC
jgi:hypothetical protein